MSLGEDTNKKSRIPSTPSEPVPGTSSGITDGNRGASRLQANSQVRLLSGIKIFHHLTLLAISRVYDLFEQLLPLLPRPLPMQTTTMMTISLSKEQMRDFKLNSQVVGHV
jgi:hypothetical protein